MNDSEDEVDQKVTRLRSEQALEALSQMLTKLRKKGVTQLPPETDLSNMIGVSRNTLRQALARLEAEGQIERRRRVGTIIKASRPRAGAWLGSDRAMRLTYPIDKLLSVADLLSNSGVNFTVCSYTARSVQGSAGTLAKLGLPEESPVCEVQRVYAIEGDKAILVEHTLPEFLEGHRLEVDTLTGSIVTFLREYAGIHIDSADHSVSIISADEEVARELDVSVGHPLLCVQADLVTSGGSVNNPKRVVCVGRLVFRSEYIQLTASAA